MDTIREYTDGAPAIATNESNFHKDAYNYEQLNSPKLPLPDSTQSTQLEHRGLLPDVKLSEIPVDTRRQIDTLAGAGNGGVGYSEQVNQGLREIVDRHGVDGFNRMIGVLDKLSNGNFATFRFDLRNSGANLENSLSNLERLCDPDVARSVLDLDRTMRQEGYTQRLSIEDLSPDSLRMLSNQPEERRAFIEFNNEARHSMGPAFFLQAVPEMLDARPSEQLRLYRIWLAERNTHRSQ